jgi:uncharacterized glyoxalase superfamily protein PhnB
MTQIVTPYLLYEDGPGAIEFLTRAFGFREVDRTTGAAGGLHAELRTEHGGQLYLGSPGGAYKNPATVGRTTIVHVMVDDVDAHHDRARAEGATIIEELRDLPFGHRRYSCRDPQGHEWSFAMSI